MTFYWKDIGRENTADVLKKIIGKNIGSRRLMDTNNANTFTSNFLIILS